MADQNIYDPELDENAPNSEQAAPESTNETNAGGQAGPGQISHNRDGTPKGGLAQASESNTGGHPKSRLRQAEGEGSKSYSPKGDDTANKSVPEPAARLKNSEERASSDSEDQFASGFDKPDKGSRKTRAKAFTKKHNKKFIIGGGILGGGLVGIMIAIMSFIPLKIEHMVTNLQDRFFSAPERAVQTTTRVMAQRYIVRYVIPNLKNCGTTINKECKVRVSATTGNPVTSMYRTWSNARLENTLATKYKIEFHYNPHSKTMRITYPGSSADGVDIGRNGEKLEAVINHPDQKKVKQVVNTALDKETKLKKMYYRFKVGPLLKQKFGFKRCIFFCGTRKAIKAPIEDAKDAAKLVLAERVLKPRSESTFLAVECILNDSCRPDTQVDSVPCTPGEDCNLNGIPESDLERDQRTTLTNLAAQYDVDLEKLRKTHSDLSERGFQRYLVDQVLQKVFKTASEQSVRKATDAIPIIGWINLTAELWNAAHDAGPKIKKLGYLVNAASAVSLYMEYRTFADEIHTGEVDPNVLGSMVDSLGQQEGSKEDPLIGGPATAEASPLYDDVMKDGSEARVSNGTASLLGAVLPAKAFAATEEVNNAGSADYKCNNDKPPKGSGICSEEKLGQGNGVANAVSEFLELPVMNVITKLAQTWRSTIGVLFNAAGSVGNFILSPVLKIAQSAADASCTSLGSIGPIELSPSTLSPPNKAYCEVRDVAKEAAPKVVEGVTNYLIPNPFGTNMGGGRTFTMMAAGANVSGNDSCEQLGCQAVSNSVASKIINEQKQEAREEFASQSFSERMLDTTSTYSLVSRIAVATPFDMQASAQNSFTNLMTNPFSSFASLFGSIFTQNAAFAASESDPDPFDIGTVAFPDSKIPSDPEKYWDDHNCGDTSEDGPISRWQKKAAEDAKAGRVNPDTGMPVHTDVEPCLLIKQATGAAGGYFDSSLLTEDDKAEIGTGGANDSVTTPQGDAQELAQKLIDSGRISDENGKYMPQIKAVAEGDFSCNINPGILKMLVGVVVQDEHTLVISSLNRKCTNTITDSGTASFHYKASGGHAVDVVKFDGAPVTGSGAATVGYLKTASKYLPKNTGYGQVKSCGSDFKIPNGSYAVTDECHHQHIEIPVKRLAK